jgi:hypothetical protein
VSNRNYGIGPKDGIRGPASAAEVLAFQKRWNFYSPDDPLAEDGIYGPQTAARYARVWPTAKGTL